MKFIIALIFALAGITGTAPAETLSITGPNRSAILEGETYTISWAAVGLRSVSIVAHGKRTPLGEKSRGSFSFAIAEQAPAGVRFANWTVPWIDAVTFYIKAKGYNLQGRLVAVDEVSYGFRPAVLANRMQDGLYLDLHKRSDQRLYVQRDYKITHAYISSSSENYLWRPPGSHIKAPHDHAGVFSILEKKPVHWSTLFQVRMPWAMRYHGGHFVHATSRNLYRYLGRPASHGCNRLTNYDARKLYHMTPLGTRIEVIGPEG
ncbi:MAG: L,D-transpeptidase [Armatimonadetes bacterium]|nr:L,D-transpeptidase [Armatimonadota bacterium]